MNMAVTGGYGGNDNNCKYVQIDWSKSSTQIKFGLGTHNVVFKTHRKEIKFIINTYDLRFYTKVHDIKFGIKTENIKFNVNRCSGI